MCSVYIAVALCLVQWSPKHSPDLPVTSHRHGSCGGLYHPTYSYLKQYDFNLGIFCRRRILSFVCSQSNDCILELMIPTWVSAFWVLPLPGPYLTAEDERGEARKQDGYPASP